MAILEKVDKLHQAVAWKGDIPITSRYTAGIAGERFFREIKDKARFLGTHCEACGLTYVPATMFCERCFAELEQWVEVPNRGWLFTYTVLHRDLDDKPLDPPVILAYVIHRDNTRMIQIGHGPRFSLEPGKERRIAGKCLA